MEELTDNAEEPDEAESKQSEVKLGKLQYKVYRRNTMRLSFIVKWFASETNDWRNLFEKY